MGQLVTIIQVSTLPSSFWLNRPVFVTGGSGLLGPFVIRQLLSQQAHIVCLVRDWVPESLLLSEKAFEKCTLVRGELQDQALLERTLNEYEIRSVFHLAAQAIVGTANRNPASTFDSNIRGTWTLLEACRRSPLLQEIIVASSDKAYGEQPRLPYTEDMPLSARNPYDASKACTDIIAQSYALTFNLPIAIARCGNIYGEGDLNWNRVIPGTIRSALKGERPIVRSDGSPIRDYFYAEDAARAYLLLAEHLHGNRNLRGEAFNFSNEEPISVSELISRILHILESKLTPDIHNEAHHEIQEQYLSAKKAHDQLKWKAQYSLEDGLRRTIQWYQSFLSQNA